MSTFQYPNAEGGRLYHVDARALIYSNGKFSLPSNPDEIIDSSDLLYRGISNSQAGERAESNYCSQIKDYFDEIRWISKDKKLIDGGVNAPTENIFFEQGDKFSLKEYGTQFYYDGKFDNEEEFSTTFETTSLS